MAGGFVFVSGQVALEPRQTELMGGTIGEQTEQVFANLRAILEAAGSGLDRLVKTTVYLVDLGDFAGTNEVTRSTSATSRLEGDDRSGGPACGRARRGRGRSARLTAGRHNLGAMRAETIIATHANTDFDAFASMLAVRRLYPGSVVCVSGSLNRNVRELCRLYAEELELVQASRLELEGVRRLIVVEATNASRLGELEPVALDTAVEKVVFDHHAGESPDWAPPDNVVVSGDGALTTTLVGILAEREIAVSALEATVFALGIHEDTGSLTYPSATQRDADALSWCLRHGARQDLLGRYLHHRSRPGAWAARRAHRRAGHARTSRDHRARRGDLVAKLCRGRLEPRAQDRRPHGYPRARAAGRDGPPRVLRRAQPDAVVRRGAQRLALWAAVGTSRRPQRSTEGRSPMRSVRFSRRCPRPSPSRCAPATSCRSRLASSRRATPLPRRWRSASATTRAACS